MCNAPILRVRKRYCNVYTLSISTGKNQSTEASGALYIPTYEYNTKLSLEMIQYYMNITSLICAIARLQRDVQDEQYTGTHEFTKGKLDQHISL